jgi:hypothetical protein
MSHCHDFFRKWKREYNFCGLRPQDAKEMDRYIDLSEKIAASGAEVDIDFIHDHFTAGAARPLLRCKDERAYEKALNYVVACLKREEDITGGDLQATINGFLGKKVPVKSTQMREATVKDSLTVPPANETYKGHMGQSLGDQIRADEIKAADVNQPKPDHIVEVNKMVSPFKTAAEVKAGIAGEMYPDAVPESAAGPAEPAENPAVRRQRLAEELLSTYSDRFQREARRIIQSEPTWKHGAADFFYFAGEMLIDPPKKVSVEPRRGK